MKRIYLVIILMCVISVSYAQNWTITSINKSNSKIPSDDVCSMAMDKSGQLWVAAKNGIGKFSNNEWSEVKIKSSIYEFLNVWTTGDSVWIGTEYYGLWRLSDNKWTNYDPNTLGNGIVGFTLGRNDTLFRLDKFGSFDKWTGSSWSDIVIFIERPEFVYCDTKKNIWVGSGNMGLYRYYDGSVYQFKNNLINTSAKNYIPAYDLNCMVEDSDSSLWIGTGDRGLLKYEKDKWKIIPTPSNAVVMDIDIDKSDRLWLATDKGIMRYSNEEWVVLDTSNSTLPDNRVVSILVENENKIWAAVGYHENSSPHFGKGIVCLTNEHTGNQLNSTAAYKIYPNPTTKSVVIDLDKALTRGTEITITNLQGERVYSTCVTDEVSTFKIDMERYSKGIYLISIQSDRGTINGKIVKTE